MKKSMKPLPPRDHRGRFCRKPAPTLLSPEVLKTLGQGRRAAALFVEQPWEFVIEKIWHYSNLAADEPQEN